MIPDLGDLPVLEAKDVRGREADPPPSRLNATPRAQMRAGRRPAPNDKLPLADNQIDIDLKVGEVGAKIVRDLLLAARAGSLLSGPEIMT
jgi:hypothetical protein